MKFINHLQGLSQKECPGKLENKKGEGKGGSRREKPLVHPSYYKD